MRTVYHKFLGAILFYAKSALNYMLLYKIQKRGDTGYPRWMERRMKKNRRQEFFPPASEVVVKLADLLLQPAFCIKKPLA